MGRKGFFFMKKYKVKVNNKLYEVEVEELTNTVKSEEKEVKMDSQEEVQIQTAPVGEISGEKVLAPLPGNISSIVVKKGDQVTEGDVLFILEAMKMENEITAPVSGIVKEIYITQGTAVDTEELLAVIA